MPFNILFFKTEFSGVNVSCFDILCLIKRFMDKIVLRLWKSRKLVEYYIMRHAINCSAYQMLLV
jgi:hypothetical protein